MGDKLDRDVERLKQETQVEVQATLRRTRLMNRIRGMTDEELEQLERYLGLENEEHDQS